MKAVIHQPNYLPGLTYFHKIATADVFIVLDDVQYSKNNWTNRNRVKAPQGPAWLTVPVLTKGRLGQRIIGAEIDGRTWAERHWKTIQTCYGRTAGFGWCADAFHTVLMKPWVRLAELNLALIELVIDVLGIHTPLRSSSELGVAGTETARLVNLCAAVGADTYLSGPGGRNYHDESLFEGAGIRIGYHEFRHPQYPQPFGAFEPNLSIIDLLFNVGLSAREVLLSNMGENL